MANTKTREILLLMIILCGIVSTTLITLIPSISTMIILIGIMIGCFTSISSVWITNDKKKNIVFYTGTAIFYPSMIALLIFFAFQYL